MKKRLYSYQGQMLNLNEIANRAGIGQAALYHRVVRKGMTIAKATSRPVDQRYARSKAKLYLFRGQWMTMKEAATLAGVTVATIGKRRSGDTILEGEDLIDPFRDPHPRARLFTVRNRTKCIAEWSRETGVQQKTIAQRIAKGWPVGFALTVPPHVGGFDTITHAGRTMTLGRWANERGMSPQTLRARLNAGWDVAKALSTEPRKQRNNSTPRYPTTFTPPVGTGGGSLPRHLHGEKSL